MLREYRPADLAQLQRIYQAQGFTYPFPDLQKPLFVSKLVLADRGRVEIAICSRLTAEGYVLMDPEVGDPESRWAKLKQIHRAAELDLYHKGLEDVHCWVPPEMVKAFGRRLVRDLGWVRDDAYTPFCKYLVPD